MAHDHLNGALPDRYNGLTLSQRGEKVAGGKTDVTETSLVIGAPTSDDGEVLISRSSWPLRLSGLLFAGLLVVGRAASGGQIVWLPAYHANPTPLIVVINQPKPGTPATPTTPALPKSLPGNPAAAISKKSAASEVVTFSPGKNSGSGDAFGLPDATDTPSETGHSDTASGGSVGTAAGETGISDVQGSSGTQGTGGNETGHSDVQGSGGTQGTARNESGSSGHQGSGGKQGTAAGETGQSDIPGSAGSQGTAGNETGQSDIQGSTGSQGTAGDETGRTDAQGASGSKGT